MQIKIGLTRARIEEACVFLDSDALAPKGLECAARMADFEAIHFQLEPIAAALAYERTLTKPQTVLVADLGGSTTDYTIMKLDPPPSAGAMTAGMISSLRAAFISVAIGLIASSPEAK